MVFSEDSRVKIPCILHLVRLGYPKHGKPAVGATPRLAPAPADERPGHGGLKETKP